MGLYFCKVTSIQELADKIRVGKRIPKASVIQESKSTKVPRNSCLAHKKGSLD